MANLKLNHFEGSRRCCNAAILLLNRPDLRLDEMGIDDDLTDDITLMEPINWSRLPFVLKSLYRRGKSLMELRLYHSAKEDFLKALSMLGSNSAEYKKEVIDIESCLAKVQRFIEIEDKTPCNQASDIFAYKSIPLEDFSMVNGGYCLLRKGAWSQSVKDVDVHLPVSIFAADVEQLISEGAIILESSAVFRWKVEFESSSLKIFCMDKLIFLEALEYNIISSESYWTLEEVKGSAEDGKQAALWLHLRKATSLEWFPGCEWWDRIFPADEPIETLTCSVGANVDQLPEMAKQRAEKENALFMDMTPVEQRSALERLASAKDVKEFDPITGGVAVNLDNHCLQAFKLSEIATRAATQEENQAIAEVPERAELLASLREQFPSIAFSAK